MDIQLESEAGVSFASCTIWNCPSQGVSPVRLGRHRFRQLAIKLPPLTSTRMTDEPPCLCPPVKAKLRELLKDYPDLIQRLQEVLDDYFKKPDRSIPFDGAIWALEGRLGSFMSEAREELKSAEASGDPVAIEKAQVKERLTRFARSSNRGMSDLNELWDYVEQHKAALK